MPHLICDSIFEAISNDKAKKSHKIQTYNLVSRQLWLAAGRPVRDGRGGTE